MTTQQKLYIVESSTYGSDIKWMVRAIMIAATAMISTLLINYNA